MEVKETYKKRSREEFDAQRLALIKLGVKVRGGVLMQDDTSCCSKLSLEESNESPMERLGPWMLLEKLGGGSYGKVIRA